MKMGRTFWIVQMYALFLTLISDIKYRKYFLYMV